MLQQKWPYSFNPNWRNKKEADLWQYYSQRYTPTITIDTNYIWMQIGWEGDGKEQPVNFNAFRKLGTQAQ